MDVCHVLEHEGGIVGIGLGVLFGLLLLATGLLLLVDLGAQRLLAGLSILAGLVEGIAGGSGGVRDLTECRARLVDGLVHRGEYGLGVGNGLVAIGRHAGQHLLGSAQALGGVGDVCLQLAAAHTVGRGVRGRVALNAGELLAQGAQARLGGVDLCLGGGDLFVALGLGGIERALGVGHAAH